MSGMMRKFASYIGIVEDEYLDEPDFDDYEPEGDYEAVPAAAQRSESVPARARVARPARPRVEREQVGRAVVVDSPPQARPRPSGSVRPLQSESEAASARQPTVRPIRPLVTAPIQVVSPLRFEDAKDLGDKLKSSLPVVMNLLDTERDTTRRILDFASGLAYGLSGKMEKIAPSVFLIRPATVEVSAEDLRRLEERGFQQRP